MMEGSTQDITEYATWITNDKNTALVSDESGIKGIANGVEFSDSAMLEVTPSIFPITWKSSSDGGGI
ncbi:TPA: hypothetical protein JG841_004594 [Vibrio parahaemolyticus]|nr:hypothetical protein [Vibrio parahaemolyticus]